MIHSFHGARLTLSEEVNTLKHRETSINFEPVLGHYNSNVGDAYHQQKSGAYIFRVNTNQFAAKDWVVNGRSILCGYVVCMLYVDYNFSHDAQLFTFPLVDVEDSWLHVDTFVDSIKLKEPTGKNVISQYKTNIFNNSTFYTDMNGMSLIERKWNDERDWEE